MRLHQLMVSLVLLPSMGKAAISQQNWKVCAPPLNNSSSTIKRPSNIAADATYLEADTAVLQTDGDSSLSGNAFIVQQDQSLQADNIRYNHPTKQVNAEGNVQLKGEFLALNSEAVDYNFDSQQGEILQAYYNLAETGARGESQRIMRQGREQTSLEGASYTTCPPNDESWKIESSSITLLHEQGRGVARDVRFKVKDVPIFYFPYFSFPLGEQRKSGFLIPSFKSDENSGVQISLPYYFNLAPNFDWTLTPIIFSKRGVMLDNEFRYLSENQGGKITYKALPNDKESPNNDLRYQFGIEHKMRFDEGKKGELQISAGGVSDNDYINDFGGSLAATSTINMERKINYQLQGERWSFKALAQDFQVLDTGTDPYTRLPQLTFDYQLEQKPLGFDLNSHTDFTHFYSENQRKANRLHFDIKATQDISNSWGFFRPGLRIQHTEYALDNDPDDDAVSATSFSRTLPTVSLDAGLIFERNLDEFLIQTLEPRAYYTHTPYKDQSHIPVFDSSEKSINYQQLFSDSRFTGKDRIGDSNQLTTSLTTRIQDRQSGLEKLRLSIGQIYYFEDRLITLPDEEPETGQRSEIVTEIAGQINPRTRIKGTGFYNTDDGNVSAHQLELNYSDHKGRSLNLGYSERRDDFEAASLSFAMPVNENWKIGASWNYDIDNDRTLETVAGLQYESCCWKARVASRRYLLTDNETYDNAAFVEFELKGLGNIGSGARELLRNRIQGYE